MSGLMHDVATPCPSRLNGSSFCRKSDSSFDSLWERTLDNGEETANVEFTTEIKPSVLTGAKPRRRTKTGSSFMIHDDHEEKPTQIQNRPKRESSITAQTTNRKTSLLAQPAQRFRPKVSFAPSPRRQSQEKELIPKTHSERDTEKNNELLMQISGKGDRAQPKDRLKADVRRNTVYIPPDDTTVASVFMGLFSPLKSDNIGYHIPEDTQINSLEAQIAQKRQAKRSLASSAQRAPLQPSWKVTQESSTRVDIAGKNGGKENIPPGTVILDGKKGLQPLKAKRPLDDNLKVSQLRDSRSSQINKGARASQPLTTKTSNLQRSTVLGDSQNNTKARPSKANPVDTKRKLTTSDSKPAFVRSSTITTSLKQSRTNTGAPKSALQRNVMGIEKDYPIISNITNPTLYEDNWLSHQEVVITQLANELFQCADGDAAFDDPTMLRQELLTLYQGTSFTHLHKRLQASLLYGAMSVPKDVLARSSRLRQDLGMKRRYLDIWVQTYDLQALRAAVEAITGRKIPKSKVAAGNEGLDKERSMKRRLEVFLDAFLLQNKDMDRHANISEGDEGDVASRAYRRTVIRSIMIVILLDQGRLCSGTALPRRLFLSASPYKTSVAVLQALARMLLPSCGDIAKTLSHLNCELSYKQDPLQEYEYQMDNLAIDLRDGVRLTRIVELLLHSPASPAETQPEDSEWPLSRSLKFPCMSRAVKLFNVQVALDALASAKGTRKLVSTVRAEDIVNGHREKTIALLWGLVSTWGLAGLVDWAEVRTEIERLKQKAVAQYGYNHIKDEEWFCDKHSDKTHQQDDEPILLLTQWASILAHLKGLRLENLSTSFSDGRIYESIVDEYEGYLLGDRDNICDKASSSSSCSSPSSLNSRLQALGCTAQFAKLVSPSPSPNTHVPIVNADFTIGALAFLCSRLLAATKRARAATVLQAAWRRILARRDHQRRIIARDLARQCAAVVQARDRIIWAQGVILQWWRKMQTQRRRRTVGGKKMNNKSIPRYRYQY
ncbi:hypothetical protein BO70DRAFT_314156 [Aspergillus heteromorphus CBS 117.55]|uniref:Calponin-homology (CH) domain-containing protein n=1 Tax=Aspergillus heteromorphus CBS 117.55 TaxID=1448321 RepID=A0A317W8A7_9EURO|nr:uncharacterized protein BO70DRAFT_314156 [Aspergillus heteromorphus CBS 117.55]PWY82846.1 hypothetical protein BO70DRAFT_314156 [Aspergillus heteromorphus CBS 117.55]